MDHASVTEQIGKFWAKLSGHMLGVVAFEVPIVALVKVNYDGHDLAGREFGGSLPIFGTVCQLLHLPDRLETLQML